MLAVAFVTLALWWLTWFSYSPDAVRRVVPSHAAWVSEHLDGAARLDVLRTHPVVRQALAQGGVGQEAVDSALEARGSGMLIRWLAGRHLVVGYLPYLRHGGGPAWMAAGWGGSGAQLLRWALALGLFGDGVVRLPSRYPVTCWIVETPGDGPVFSFAITEGVVIGCYAMDPAGVRDLVIHMSRRDDPFAFEVMPATAKDRAVCHWPGAVAGGRAAYGRVALDLGATNRAGLKIDWPEALPLPAFRSWQNRGSFAGLVPGRKLPELDCFRGAHGDAGKWYVVRSMLGTSAAAVVDVPLACLDAADTGASALNPVLERLRPMMRADGRVVVSMLRGSHSGRILGIKTPVLVVAFERRRNMAWKAAVVSLLDDVNAAGQLGLIPRQHVGAEGYEYLVIDTGGGGVFQSLKRAEKPALTVVQDWIVVASNLQVLERLVGMVGQLEPATVPGWWADVAEARSEGNAWLDLEESSLALRKVSAMVALVQIAQGRGGNATARGGMNRAAEWLTALQPLQTARLSLNHTNAVWSLDLSMGE